MSKEVQQQTRNWPCIALALVPFVASVWFTGQPAPSAVHGQRKSASLVFDQYMANYLHPVSGPLIEVPFAYRNVSDKEVRIQSLTPSCGCLQPTIESMTIPPGTYGRLMMPIQTANEAAGPHEYLVKVLYEDGEPHEVDLALKIVLAEKQVEVSPRAMWFYQSGTKATIQRVTITDHRPQTKPFKITRITCSSDLWTVEKTSDLQHSSHKRVVQLNVKLRPDVPPGTHRAIINVETDDPRFPRHQIRVGLQSMATDEGMAMKAEPDTVVLQPTPGGTMEASTVVRTADGKLARIKSVQTSSEFVTATYETNANDEAVIKVSASLPPTEAERTQRAVVTVTTEGDETPLTIPVLIRPDQN